MTECGLVWVIITTRSLPIFETWRRTIFCLEKRSARKGSSSIRFKINTEQKMDAWVVVPNFSFVYWTPHAKNSSSNLALLKIILNSAICRSVHIHVFDNVNRLIKFIWSMISRAIIQSKGIRRRLTRLLYSLIFSILAKKIADNLCHRRTREVYQL